MRILGHISHPVYQITVFKMDLRLTLQIEHGKYAQVYKFDQIPELESLQGVESLLTPEYLEQVSKTFQSMHVAYLNQLSKLIITQGDGFDVVV